MLGAGRQSGCDLRIAMALRGYWVTYLRIFGLNCSASNIGGIIV